MPNATPSRKQNLNCDFLKKCIYKLEHGDKPTVTGKTQSVYYFELLQFTPVKEHSSQTRASTKKTHFSARKLS